jgi:hypothetical protein
MTAIGFDYRAERSGGLFVSGKGSPDLYNHGQLLRRSTIMRKAMSIAIRDWRVDTKIRSVQSPLRTVDLHT